MVGKTAFLVVALGLAAGLFNCAGPTGKGMGESCSSQDDCSTDLTCQPVYGRQGDFCCPTPADAGDTSSSSNGANCVPPSQ